MLKQERGAEEGDEDALATASASSAAMGPMAVAWPEGPNLMMKHGAARSGWKGSSWRSYGREELNGE